MIIILSFITEKQPSLGNFQPMKWVFFFSNFFLFQLLQYFKLPLGILETSICMFISYLIVAIVTLIFAKILQKKNLLHSTFKIYIASVLFQFFSYLFTLSEYGQFSSSGIFTGGCAFMGRFLDAIAQTLFILMLILLAKGYTVTRGRLRTPTVLKIIILFTIYVIAYVITFMYSELVSSLFKSWSASYLTNAI